MAGTVKDCQVAPTKMGSFEMSTSVASMAWRSSDTVPETAQAAPELMLTLVPEGVVLEPPAGTATVRTSAEGEAPEPPSVAALTVTVIGIVALAGTAGFTS